MSDTPDRLRRQATRPMKDYALNDAVARRCVESVIPRATRLRYADALYVIAREAGYPSWPKLKLAVEVKEMDRDKRVERLKMAL
jgi:hypothetical protein